MTNTLYDCLQLYAGKKIYPFHMPGHKGKLSFDNLLKLDITEIPGFDNLHNPNGIIKQAQIMAADTFGADDTFFCINGSTAAIIASILTCVSNNDKIIVARNSHRSVYSGLALSGAAPIYVYPKIIEPFFINASISPYEIKQAFKKNNNVKAVIITSPTYEGVVSDIEQISFITHEHNAVLIVDEAHGAHFKFNSMYPKPALDCNADLVIQSLHKTLPALTQCSLLHVKGNRVNRSTLGRMLSLVQTSSPSYILMASIDMCRSILDQYKHSLFNAHIFNVLNFKNQIQDITNIELLSKKISCNIYDMDFSRLTFLIKKGHLSGYEYEKLLLDNFKIQIEMSSLYYFVAIATIADDALAFSNFANSLTRIYSGVDNVIPKYYTFNSFKSVAKKTLREATFFDTMKIQLNKSVGKISADFIIPYPPGVPIIVPGEVITENIINYIFVLMQKKIEVLGIYEEEVLVCKSFEY